ncbi:MAG: cysteine synthase family protein, partial [Leptospira sp.]|nr:cysteine synthase family protein [Leptospira sp.]
KSIDELGNSVLGALGNIQSFLGTDLSLATPIKKDIFQAIGNTPLIRLNNIGVNLKGIDFYLKAEFFNPTGSVKDRTALALILDAEKRGVLKKNGIIIDTSCDNQSVSFAWVGKARGYKVICILNETATDDLRLRLKKYGAEMQEEKSGHIALAGVQKKFPDALRLDQYSSMANPNVHFKTTGPEIFRDLGGNVEGFVSWVDSGGTISGVGRFLKSQREETAIVAAYSNNSKYDFSKIGSGTGFKGAVKIPETYDTRLIDASFFVNEYDSAFYRTEILEKEGIYSDLGTGAGIAAALKYSEDILTKKSNSDKPLNIVILASA